MRVELRFTTDELDGFIAKAKSASQRQRLRVIRWAMEGLTAPEVATQTKLCRRQVQNWGRRFNALGLAGLKDEPGRGRPCPLSAEQQVKFKARLEARPTAEDQVCTLRGEDIRRILQTQRPDPEAAERRDAGGRHRDLFRQDRHADSERDDGSRDCRWW